MQENVRESALDENEVDIRRLLEMILGGRWIIAAATVGFFVLSIAYVLLAKPIYEANALLQVEQQGGALSSLTDLTSLLGNQDASSISEIDILQSRRVLGQAVDDQNLTIDLEPATLRVLRFLSAKISDDDVVATHLEVPSYLEAEKLELLCGDNGKYSLFHDGEKIADGKAGTMLTAFDGTLKLLITRQVAESGTRFNLVHIPRELAIATLSKELKVEELGKQSGILKISLDGPKKSRIIATIAGVADAYVQQNVQRRAEEAKKSLVFLSDQLPKVKADLYKSENALNSFRLQRGSLDMELEAKSVLERSSLLEQQLADLSIKQAEVSRLYSPEHPEYKALLDQRGLVQRQLEGIKRQVADLPDVQQKLLRLSRDVEVNERLYLQMFDKIQELDVVRAGTVGNVRILDSADAEWKPVRPKKALTIVLGTFLGLMVGICIAILREMMNPGVESAEELENADIEVLAVVPISEEQKRIEKETRRDTKRSGVTINRIKRLQYLLGVARAEDTAIESLRSLRTSLHFSMLEAKNNVVMISGPSPEVGKTFVSANFGVVLAQSGQSVLLIDADLRRGNIHDLFNLPPHQGLSDLLSGKLSREVVIKSSGTPGLDVLGRGTAPASPSELLLLPKFTEFLNWASSHYDMVLIDTPPILAVTDAAIVGRHAGTTLLIVRHRLNSIKEIALTIKRFAQNGVHVNGCVLNGLERGVGGYGYKYGYYTYEYRSTQDS